MGVSQTPKYAVLLFPLEIYALVCGQKSRRLKW